MKEHPIISAGELVLPILNGKKTQTRRVIKPQPVWVGDPCVPFKTPDADPEGIIKCPYGKPGDRLWVRETWQTGMGVNGPQITYKATPDYFDIDAWEGEDFGAGSSFDYTKCPGASWHTNLSDLINGVEGAWRPSIHMPRWASRISLEVMDVRVERLQNISEEDAKAEGVDDPVCNMCNNPVSHEAHWVCEADYKPELSYTKGFRNLWNSINEKRGFGWDINPWVWAVTFKLHSINGAPA